MQKVTGRKPKVHTTINKWNARIITITGGKARSSPIHCTGHSSEKAHSMSEYISELIEQKLRDQG